MSKSKSAPSKQLLHLVFGGRVLDPRGLTFESIKDLDVVGIYPSYREAEAAWRSAAQRTVDDAQMRYVVVHIHRLLEELPTPDDEDEAN